MFKLIGIIEKNHNYLFKKIAMSWAFVCVQTGRAGQIS